MIKVKGIVKSFGEKAVLSDFNTIFEDGTLTTIYGKSGSGKTTLLNIIGLIEKPNEGEVIFNNIVVKGQKRKRLLLRYNIGFLFKNFALLDDETVYENLSILYKLRKIKNQEKIHLMKEVLLKVGLQDILNKKIYECSGGEQQRIALAKLMLKDCLVILCDEPTASLDRGNKETVLYYLKQFRDEGKIVIVVTHDEELEQYANQVIRLV